MSPKPDIPEPWRTAMENAGLYNISARALADKAGIGITTVTGLVYGRRHSDEETIQAVADALRVKVTTIREWASRALGEEGPFELPPEANQLTKRQRNAIRDLVRAMLDPVGETAADTSVRRRRATIVPLGRPAEELDPPAPNLTGGRVAARRGTSEGRRQREAQDADAETQDPSHPPQK